VKGVSRAIRVQSPHLNISRRSTAFPVGSAAIVSLGKDGDPVLSPRAMLSHEPIEWPDEVEVLVDRLESESARKRKELDEWRSGQFMD